MSLFGAMWTSVSGMNAQSNRISSVADNIANSATTGYKRSAIEFETVLVENAAKNFTSGAVASVSRAQITEQGALQHTSSVTDLGIQGGGFFVVAGANGTPYLTRSGSFVPDSTGNLVNAAGFTLLGIPLPASGSATPTPSSLSKVNVDQSSLVSTPSTLAKFSANLPSAATPVVAADLPSANAATATYTAKSSIQAYDNLGAPVTLDVYFSNTGTNTWEATAFDASTAAPGGGFPYSSGPLTTQTLTFSAADGSMTGTTTMPVAVPGGATLNIDLSKSTQLASAYAVSSQTVNGSAPSHLDHIEINNDGILSMVYQNGARVDAYRIPLASCTSPDRLTTHDGDTFSESLDSGTVIVGDAQTGKLGSITSNALEASTVDLASELTTMIAAQRGYSANSKVFQTSSDLLDVLIKIQ